MKQLKITKFPALDYAGNEAFNTLSTNLSFAGASVKKIMITSCHAAEGKSYLSINLMRTLAQRGIKVALVDADLRRSMVNNDYGLKYEDGRSDGTNQNTRVSDRFVENGSYLRLKNITLSYTFPKQWLQKAQIENARLSLSCENVATITGYSGFDPEVGINGIDQNRYPISRTFSLGLNFNF